MKITKEQLRQMIRESMERRGVQFFQDGQPVDQPGGRPMTQRQSVPRNVENSVNFAIHALQSFTRQGGQRSRMYHIFSAIMRELSPEAARHLEAEIQRIDADPAGGRFLGE